MLHFTSQDEYLIASKGSICLDRKIIRIKNFFLFTPDEKTNIQYVG